MRSGSARPLSWPALALRAAAIALCALLLQQCSRPSGGPSSPTGPTQPPLGPPTVPTPTPTPPGPETFVGAGDIANCTPLGNQEATARLLDTIGGRIFTLGDNAYPNGSVENYRDCYEPSWGRHKDRTRPSPGNHEYNTPGAAPYFQYFGTNAGPAGLGYYSYEVGAWHAISLTSDEGVVRQGAMEAWLRSDLAQTSATKCTVAYWHHPLFTSGPNQDNQYMRGIFRALYEANADVVLNGHDHLYERFAPQDPEGRRDDARGIRQFVVGSGGVPFYNFMAVKPNSERRVTGPGMTGVLKMTLMADSYQWEFITTGQGVPDSGSGTCH